MNRLIERIEQSVLTRLLAQAAKLIGVPLICFLFLQIWYGLEEVKDGVAEIRTENQFLDFRVTFIEQYIDRAEELGRRPY